MFKLLLLLIRAAPSFVLVLETVIAFLLIVYSKIIHSLGRVQSRDLGP